MANKWNALKLSDEDRAIELCKKLSYLSYYYQLFTGGRLNTLSSQKAQNKCFVQEYPGCRVGG